MTSTTYRRLFIFLIGVIIGFLVTALARGVVTYPTISQSFYERLHQQYKSTGLNSIGGEDQAILQGEYVVFSGKLYSVVIQPLNPAFPDEWHKAVLTDDDENTFEIETITYQNFHLQFDPEANPLPTAFSYGGYTTIQGQTVHMLVHHAFYDSDGFPLPDDVTLRWGTSASYSQAGPVLEWQHLSVPAGAVGWHGVGEKGFGPLHVDPVSRKCWNWRVLQPQIPFAVFAPLKFYASDDLATWTQSTVFTAAAIDGTMIGKSEFYRVGYTFSGALLTAHNNAMSGHFSRYYKVGNP